VSNTLLTLPLIEVLPAAILTSLRTVIAKDIVKLNADVATAFGVFLSGVDIISTIPSNANDGAVANDDAGKIGGLKCFRLLRGFIRVSTPSASHSDKSCWYTGYTHQIDLTITACGSSTQGNTDEATQQSKTLQPHLELRAATIYSGTGPLTILASPLSEVAYQLADTNSDSPERVWFFMAAFRTPITSVALLPLVAAIYTFKARAIRKISLYNGEDNDPVPTVQDYVDIGIGIGIGSVGDDNLSLKNLRIAAEKDRTKKDSVEEIRAIVSSQSNLQVCQIHY
jgi:hypothetical protein